MDVRVPRFAETAPEVGPKPYRPWLIVQVMIVAAVAGAILGVAMTVFWGRGPLASYEYDLWRWQAETTPGLFLRLVGVNPGLDGMDDTEILQRYFAYTTAIRNESNELEPDREYIDHMLTQRERYEKRVQRIIGGYIDNAIDHAGAQETLPFFTDISLTWPPVEFELTQPPHVLVLSPRDTIHRLSARLLRGNLTLDDIDYIEAVAESENLVSIVIPIGGVAAYPAIVRADRNYWGVVETAAHEWIHHYLAFYPLGQQWGRSQNANVLNETVANIGGQAIADIVYQLHPVRFPDGVDGSWLARPERTLDFNEVMRELRLEVDALLDQGHVEEAERSMQRAREEFAEHGIVIREINQAYFAFHGTYANRPQSSDPIGPRVQRVWELTGYDLKTFLEEIREVRTLIDLVELEFRLEQRHEGRY